MATQAPSAQQHQPSQPSTSEENPSAQFDLAITVLLFSWPALTLAVESSWGGPTSSDKREWFCGAISDLFVSRPETDAEDLEEVLIQVMGDEFDVAVDDGSCEEVAIEICRAREEIAKGEFGRVKRMWEVYQEKQRKGGKKSVFKKVEVNEEDQETDEEVEGENGQVEEQSGKFNWADDVEMEDPPAVLEAAPRQMVEPEIDDDGFTKVVSKRRR
ncbi:hypothetical protein AJ80_00519 [Polytolypa hystricis UAMH7299]|uniref:Pre-rRNA-processing protein TSR2 n=1 Tax=Polytolypa hystricis (strain UAMH7299) TaxID=1447883 RepID=A0A2B7Z3U9_POLH7|nr:hypothetical protein AJ80_00519 [Polytolypa hystricis UAMH7299]